MKHTKTCTCDECNLINLLKDKLRGLIWDFLATTRGQPSKTELEEFIEKVFERKE